VLGIHLADALTPVWLALSNGTGFTTFQRIDDFECSSLSGPSFTIDTLTFRADESELLVEWRAFDVAGETLDREEFELVTERAGTTLCRWASAASDASIACSTVERRRVSDETRSRDFHVVSRSHAESRVALQVAEGGALAVRAVPGSAPGTLRSTLGSYAWGAWPSRPPMRP